MQGQDTSIEIDYTNTVFQTLQNGLKTFVFCSVRDRSPKRNLLFSVDITFDNVTSTVSITVEWEIEDFVSVDNIIYLLSVNNTVDCNYLLRKIGPLIESLY